MDFGNEFYFALDGKPRKRKDVPDQYQEYLPEFIEKDKFSHPYSYDPYLIYFNEKAKFQKAGTIYSDRMLHQDWDRHNELCRKHFDNEGQQWHDREIKKIQAFLCDWVGKPVVLIALIQYCNISNGYPHWRFDIAYE